MGTIVMRLISITTTNYRTLQDLTLRFSPNYCTISGRNNAGKSCVIRLLSALFGATRSPFHSSTLNYDEDRTQWMPSTEPIRVTYELLLTKDDDPALVSFIEKIASQTITNSTVTLSLSYSITSDDEHITVASVALDARLVDPKAAREIERRIEDSNLLFLYNSTHSHEEDYFYFVVVRVCFTTL
jgi:putative ATP-dependent endonuclease of OLD family